MRHPLLPMEEDGLPHNVYDESYNHRWGHEFIPPVKRVGFPFFCFPKPLHWLKSSSHERLDPPLADSRVWPRHGDLQGGAGVAPDARLLLAETAQPRVDEARVESVSRPVGILDFRLEGPEP